MARLCSETSRASANESDGGGEGGSKEIVGLRAESTASVPRASSEEKGGNREAKRRKGGVKMGAF